MAESVTVDNLDIQISASANNATSALSGLVGLVSGLSGKMSELTATVKNHTKAAEKNAKSTRKISDALQSIKDAANRASNSLKKIPRAFGRIAFYRAVRSAIKAVTSAVSEGLTNLEDYSRTVGTAFAPAVDDLRRHILLLKNSFATALRPVIEALIPVLIRLADWLSKVSDFIAQVLSVLTGKVDDKGRYTKAVLSDLQQSNKQAKELRRTLLGFDEINRLDGETQSGETSGAGTMFTQADVSEKAKVWAEKIASFWEKIKDIIAQIDWELVGKIILGILALKAGIGLAKKIQSVISALKTVGTVLGSTGGILALAALVTAAFALWGDKISEFISGAIPKVDKFFSDLKKKFGESKFLNAVLTTIGDAVKFLLEAVGKLASAIYKLFHGDFKGALDDGIEFLKAALKFAASLVFGLLNDIILPIFSAAVNAIASAWTWLHNKVFAPVANAVATAFEKVKIWIHNAVIDLKIGFQNFAKWIIEKLNAWILVPLTNMVNKAIEFINWAFGENIAPVDLTIDTAHFDEKIEELEKKKLPPLTEKVEIVGQWKEPSKLKLQIDTQAAYTAIDNLGKKVNQLGTAVSSVVTAMGAQSTKRMIVTKYASGGFPSVGTLFVAGEAGAEYVTNFNGRTGVYNTDQMSTALYNAMVAALATMPSQGGGDIYLDGEKIYTSVVRRNNNHVRSVGRSALIT